MTNAQRSIFNTLQTINDPQEIEAMYSFFKDKTKELDIKAAESFRINQKLKFYGHDNSFYEGNVLSIGRTGRVKVKLINSRYSHYTAGASFLKKYVENY